MTGRVCTKDWKVPGDDFVIPKGTRVIIPIVSILQFLLSYVISQGGKMIIDCSLLSILMRSTGLSPTNLTQKDSAVKTKARLTPLLCKPLELALGKKNLEDLELLKLIIFFKFRQCLGMNLYTVETKIMIIHLLRHFKYLSHIFFLIVK